MSVSDSDKDRVSRLLMRDAQATIGVAHEADILRQATRMLELADDTKDYEQRVVDEVQQFFHDTFVDSTWPSCPRHPNHPLWFKDGWWWCERERIAMAKLGSLGSADVSQAFLQKSVGLLVSEYLPKIERCLEHLTDEDVWWRANDASNSIGNLMLHLRGNVTQWIIGGVGGHARERRRQQEFDERTHVPAKELLANLRAVVEEAAEVIRGLDADALLGRRQIQDYDVTVLEAIYHVVEHFSMHTGQIILLTKARTGEDLKLWRPVRETISGRQ